ncbi:MAG: hypothetical protein JWN34_3255 [Bryobacterales bacterium]|nr:hypothetical protein [Bryobacterales bacterium]
MGRASNTVSVKNTQLWAGLRTTIWLGHLFPISCRFRARGNLANRSEIRASVQDLYKHRTPPNFGRGYPCRACRSAKSPATDVKVISRSVTSRSCLSSSSSLKSSESGEPGKCHLSSRVLVWVPSSRIRERSVFHYGHHGRRGGSPDCGVPLRESAARALSAAQRV